MSYHSTPAGSPPCWHCARFDGMADDSGYTAACTLPYGPRIQSNASQGCSAFQREPGADDEPGPPPCAPSRASQRRPLRPLQVVATVVAWAP